jgi:hypothetical protein
MYMKKTSLEIWCAISALSVVALLGALQVHPHLLQAHPYIQCSHCIVGWGGFSDLGLGGGIFSKASFVSAVLVTIVRVGPFYVSYW